MGSYHSLFYHIVFGTKNRKPAISIAYGQELYKYIWGIILNKRCKLYRINGVEDHIHLISNLHPSLCLSDYVKDIKVASSIWMKSSGKFHLFEGWQEGYAAFTCSANDKDRVINYIKQQREHHKTECFYDEFKRLLLESQIEFEEKYLL
jgi:REP element-mobilizing transposase RayT